MTQAKPRLTAPTGFIVCHQPNGFEVFIRITTITSLYTNAESHAGIITESGYNWILRESIDEVIAMINAATPSTAPSVDERKQNTVPRPKGEAKKEDHAWPPPPDDMRDGDLPRDPNRDPKANEWQRDRSNAAASKSQD